MKIERWREHTINTGDYENVKIGARVAVETSDDLAAVATTIADVNQLLDDALEADLVEAISVVPKGRSTHAEAWRNE